MSDTEAPPPGLSSTLKTRLKRAKSSKIQNVVADMSSTNDSEAVKDSVVSPTPLTAADRLAAISKRSFRSRRESVQSDVSSVAVEVKAVIGVDDSVDVVEKENMTPTADLPDTIPPRGFTGFDRAFNSSIGVNPGAKPRETFAHRRLSLAARADIAVSPVSSPPRPSPPRRSPSPKKKKPIKEPEEVHLPIANTYAPITDVQDDRSMKYRNRHVVDSLAESLKEQERQQIMEQIRMETEKAVREEYEKKMLERGVFLQYSDVLENGNNPDADLFAKKNVDVDKMAIENIRTGKGFDTYKEPRALTGEGYGDLSGRFYGRLIAEKDFVGSLRSLDDISVPMSGASMKKSSSKSLLSSESSSSISKSTIDLSVVENSNRRLDTALAQAKMEIQDLRDRLKRQKQSYLTELGSIKEAQLNEEAESRRVLRSVLQDVVETLQGALMLAGTPPASATPNAVVHAVASSGPAAHNALVSASATALMHQLKQLDGTGTAVVPLLLRRVVLISCEYIKHRGANQQLLEELERLRAVIAGLETVRDELAEDVGRLGGSSELAKKVLKNRHKYGKDGSQRKYGLDLAAVSRSLPMGNGDQSELVSGAFGDPLADPTEIPDFPSLTTLAAHVRVAERELGKSFASLLGDQPVNASQHLLNSQRTQQLRLTNGQDPLGSTSSTIDLGKLATADAHTTSTTGVTYEDSSSGMYSRAVARGGLFLDGRAAVSATAHAKLLDAYARCLRELDIARTDAARAYAQGASANAARAAARDELESARAEIKRVQQMKETIRRQAKLLEQSQLTIAALREHVSLTSAEELKKQKLERSRLRALEREAERRLNGFEDLDEVNRKYRDVGSFKNVSLNEERDKDSDMEWNSVSVRPSSLRATSSVERASSNRLEERKGKKQGKGFINQFDDAEVDAEINRIKNELNVVNSVLFNVN